MLAAKRIYRKDKKSLSSETYTRILKTTFRSKEPHNHKPQPKYIRHESLSHDLHKGNRKRHHVNRTRRDKQTPRTGK